MPRGQKRKKTLDGQALVRINPDELRPVIASINEWKPDDNVQLATVKRFIEELQESCLHLSDTTRQATSFTTTETAARAVSVSYDRNSLEHLWTLRHDEHSAKLSDGKLSEWADTGVTKMLSSPYFKLAKSETACRTIVDMIFCDRLEKLKDSNSEYHLNWFPETPLCTKSEHLGLLIQGKADNCLAYGESKNDLQTALVVLEAKKIGAAPLALPQLIIYLAAVQNSRKASENKNFCVFGLLTDSDMYEFAWLDKERKLFVSDTYRWITQKTRIIQWIDKILDDSIQATPHTTPVKTGNKTINGYQTYLNKDHQFGDESTGPYEVIRGDDLRRYRVVRRTRIGDVLMELESDESDESDEE